MLQENEIKSENGIWTHTQKFQMRKGLFENCDTILLICKKNSHLLLNLLTIRVATINPIIADENTRPARMTKKIKKKCWAARTTLLVIRSIDSIGPQRVTSSFSDFFSFFFLPFLPSLSNFFFLFFFVEGKNTQTEARGVVSFFPLTTSQGRAGLTTCCFTAAPPLCNWINLQSAGNKSFFYSLFSLKTFSSLFTPWERMWSKRSKMAPYSKMPTWTKSNFRWIKKIYQWIKIIYLMNFPDRRDRIEMALSAWDRVEDCWWPIRWRNDCCCCCCGCCRCCRICRRAGLALRLATLASPVPPWRTLSILLKEREKEGHRDV